jgi:hypothetical protein
LMQKGMIRLLCGDGLHPRDRQKNRNRNISHVSPRSAPTIAALSASPRTRNAPTPGWGGIENPLTGDGWLC